MKPIKEMNLQELADEMNVYTNIFPHIGLVVDRIRELHELTRWIPVGDRLPTDEDGEPFMGRVLWKWGVGYVEAKSWNNIPPKATHWRRIDKP